MPIKVENKSYTQSIHRFIHIVINRKKLSNMANKVAIGEQICQRKLIGFNFLWHIKGEHLFRQFTLLIGSVKIIIKHKLGR